SNLGAQALHKHGFALNKLYTEAGVSGKAMPGVTGNHHMVNLSR
ncbi:unnamed protein product, partial [marine sediment metagenome]